MVADSLCQTAPSFPHLQPHAKVGLDGTVAVEGNMRNRKYGLREFPFSLSFPLTDIVWGPQRCYAWTFKLLTNRIVQDMHLSIYFRILV